MDWNRIGENLWRNWKEKKSLALTPAADTKRSVRTSDTMPKPLLLLLVRQDDEKNMREFISEKTRALLICLIRFDNELQKCYNLVF